MIDRILSLVRSEPETPVIEDQPDELKLAVAALLVEAACRDDTFDEGERETIERLISEKYGLSANETHELVESAHEAQQESGHLYGFTRNMVKGMEYEERVHLIEMLWDVVYADGILDPHEDALIRRVAGLIYVSDVDRGSARRRVLDRKN
ncbi:MAG: TerB family tellurite resistance protein [Rhodospirillaceae bacterium]